MTFPPSSSPRPARRRMMAARVHQFGPPTAIQMEQIDIPEPGEKEILVRVDAAGVGPWDAWVRAGKSALPQPLPLTLGSDVSGVVVGLGVGAAGFSLGDAVFGVTNARFTGGYADYAVMAAGMVARKPATLSAVEAASAPVVATTAWQMLFDHARAQDGRAVFIHGGAGNVGAYAVQLAVRHKLRVVASALEEDRDFVRDLGAEVVTDLRPESLGGFGKRFDAIIDTVGGASQNALHALGRPGGTIVSSVSAPDVARARDQSLRPVFFIVDVNTATLAHLAAQFDAKALVANVGVVLPLVEARSAHEMLEGQRPRPRGKIVLRVGG